VQADRLVETLLNNKMALTHLLRGFWDEPWEGMTEPSRLYDQHFGNLVSDDFFGQPYRFYRPALDMALRYRYLALALFISVMLIIFAIVFSGRFGFTFFPRIQSEVARVSDGGCPVSSGSRCCCN